MSITRYITATLFACAVSLSALAQLPQNTSGLYASQADSLDVAGQLSVRVNPDLDIPMAENAFGRTDISVYPWIDLSANRIELNGADWSPLQQAFDRAAIKRVGIVHIGDSHIQADGATEVTRKLLQASYGNGGRGFIAPLKLASTNEPLNYKLTSTSKFTSARLLKRPWAVEMQFSGVAVSPVSERFDLTVDTETLRSLPDPFNVVRLFTDGAPVAVDSIKVSDGDIGFGCSVSDGLTEIRLDRSVPAITLYLRSETKTIIAGLELLNGNRGVVYSAIGNNGAGFGSYSGLRLGEKIAMMTPSLVVLSMGTNEAFGTALPERVVETIDHMVGEIRSGCPEAQILLVTPQECHSKVLLKRRNGRKRRARFVVNPRVRLMRDLIVDYGRTHGIAVYDYYAVAGGQNSTDRWVEAGLFGRDHIHLSWAGYAVMGQLLGDAIAGAIKPHDHLPEGE